MAKSSSHRQQCTKANIQDENFSFVQDLTLSKNAGLKRQQYILATHELAQDDLMVGRIYDVKI